MKVIFMAESMMRVAVLIIRVPSSPPESSFSS